MKEGKLTNLTNKWRLIKLINLQQHKNTRRLMSQKLKLRGKVDNIPKS